MTDYTVHCRLSLMIRRLLLLTSLTNHTEDFKTLNLQKSSLLP